MSVAEQEQWAQQEGDEENLIEIKMKLTGNEEFTVNVPNDVNISDLKGFVGEIMNIDGHKIKFITKGKILKDDQNLQTYGIGAGDSLVVIVNNLTPEEEKKHNQTRKDGKFQPANQRNTPSFRVPADPSIFSKIMTNQAIMDAIKDPVKMQAYIESNPVLKTMVQQDPKLKEALLNSELMQKIVTPENIEEAKEQFAKKLLEGKAQVKEGQDQVKYIPKRMNGLQVASLTLEEEVELKSQYALQIQQIKDMGFKNENTILLMLRDNDGDLEKVTKILASLLEEKK